MVKNKLVRFEVADSQAGGQRRPFAKAVGPVISSMCPDRCPPLTAKW